MPEEQPQQSPQQSAQITNQIPVAQQQGQSLLVPDDKLPSSDLADPNAVDIQKIEGFVDVLDAAPTHTPKRFWDSFKIYNEKLYYYDYKNHQWNSAETIVENKYATGTEVVTSTGNITVSGLSFDPKVIKIHAQCETGYGSSVGTYHADSGITSLLLRTWDGSTLTGSASDVGNHILDIWDDGLTDQTTGTITSVSAGFTLNIDNYYSEVDLLWEVYG